MKYLKLYQNYKQSNDLEAKNESSITSELPFKIAIIFNALMPIISLYREYLKKKKNYVLDRVMTQKLYDITGEKVNVYSYGGIDTIAGSPAEPDTLMQKWRASTMHASSNYIVYNPSFLNLFTEREMMAVLLHELYHVKNKDVVKKMMIHFFGHIPFIFWSNTGLYFLFFLFQRYFYSQRQEFAADSYTKKYGYEADLASFFLKLEEMLNQDDRRNIFKDLLSNQASDIFNIRKAFTKFKDLIQTHPNAYKRIKNLYSLADNKVKFFEDIIDSTSPGKVNLSAPNINPSKIVMLFNKLDEEED